MKSAVRTCSEIMNYPVGFHTVEVCQTWDIVHEKVILRVQMRAVGVGHEFLFRFVALVLVRNCLDILNKGNNTNVIKNFIFI